MYSSPKSSRSENMKALSSRSTPVVFWKTFTWNQGRLPMGT